MNGTNTCYESLINELEFNMQYLQETLKQDDFTPFIEGMEDFRFFLKKACMLTSGFPQVFNQFKEKDKFYLFKTFFESCENFHERLIETMEKDNIMNMDIGYTSIKDSLSLDYNKKFYNDIINELCGIDEFLKCAKKFIMVGCGSFPLTLLYIKEKYKNLFISGIDNSPEAIINAIELKNKLSLTSIFFEIIDGINYNYCNMDVIFIANLVMPKTKVLKRIAMTCKSGTVVLLRVPVMYGALLSEEVNYMELQSFELIKEVTPNKDTDDILYKLLVLKKKI